MEKEPGPLELINAVGKQSIEQAYVAVDQYFELLKRNFAPSQLAERSGARNGNVGQRQTLAPRRNISND
jgi:hypothetical protein